MSSSVEPAGHLLLELVEDAANPLPPLPDAHGKAIADFLRAEPTGRSQAALDVLKTAPALPGTQAIQASHEVFCLAENLAQELDPHFREHLSHSIQVYLLGLLLFARRSSLRDQWALYARNTLHATGDPLPWFTHLWGRLAILHDIGYPAELWCRCVHRYVCQCLRPDAQPSKDMGLTFVPTLGEQVSMYRNPMEPTGSLLDPIDLIVTRLSRTRVWPIEETTLRARFRNYWIGILSRGIPDHGILGAIIMLRPLSAMATTDVLADQSAALGLLDTSSAVFLHNAYEHFWVKTIPLAQPMTVAQHPLAYLLMLCDRLQFWGRTDVDRLAPGTSNPQPVVLNISERGIHLVVTDMPSDDARRIRDAIQKVVQAGTLKIVSA